uniref:Syntaxin 6/10/61 N-terminal domain-containing protein n=1 Tax=Kalanchoe fedtschenkoi TaxID=63787 RepID=A0A7N0TH42_KALFE
MMVANSFDLWQKDAFFAAAEEVQQSADIMESAYRLWEKERSKGLAREDLDELRRELQTALGTAKWQLEEFDKAVSLSHKTSRSDNSQTRHRQFVAAIESQISRVEAALQESLNESGGEPLRWVHLNKEECDDLAMFLSGTSKISSNDYQYSVFPKKSSPRENQNKSLDFSGMVTFGQDIPIGKSLKDATNAVDFEPQEALRARNVVSSHEDAVTGSKGSESSPESGEWRITISDDVEQRKNFIADDDTSKEKGLKLRYWDVLNAKAGGSSSISLRGISRFNQLFGRVGGFRRQLSSPRHLEHSCSKQVKLTLMLTVFLIVPFLLYST